MTYVIDTHALFWFLTKRPTLPNRTKTVIKKAAKIFIPTIVLLELLYILKKKQTEDSFLTILNRLKKNKKYTMVSFDLIVLEEVVNLSSTLEMHDRVIVATAQMLNLPLITKDETIQNVYKNTIW